jgi:hypothetical protein
VGWIRKGRKRNEEIFKAWLIRTKVKSKLGAEGKKDVRGMKNVGKVTGKRSSALQRTRSEQQAQDCSRRFGFQK